MEAFTIEMSVKKVNKGSVRYEATSKDPFIRDVYVMNNTFGGEPHPETITVTVAAAGKAIGD